MNLITKSVTAPFNLLAGIAGSDRDISELGFAPASAELMRMIESAGCIGLWTAAPIVADPSHSELFRGIEIALIGGPDVVNGQLAVGAISSARDTAEAVPERLQQAAGSEASAPQVRAEEPGRRGNPRLSVGSSSSANETLETRSGSTVAGEPEPVGTPLEEDLVVEMVEPAVRPCVACYFSRGAVFSG